MQIVDRFHYFKPLFGLREFANIDVFLYNFENIKTDYSYFCYPSDFSFIIFVQRGQLLIINCIKPKKKKKENRKYLSIEYRKDLGGIIKNPWKKGQGSKYPTLDEFFPRRDEGREGNHIVFRLY